MVHSQALGQSLKLVIKDGLFGLRLLPGDVADTESGREEWHEDDEGNAQAGDEIPHDLQDHANETVIQNHDPQDYANGTVFQNRDPQDYANETAAQNHDPQDYVFVSEGDAQFFVNSNNHETSPLAYIAFDETPPRTATKAQTSKLDANIRHLARQDKHIWNQLTKGRSRRHTLLRRSFLLEIVAGAAVVSHLASYEYGLPVSQPVDIRIGAGYDLLTKQGRDAVDRTIEEDDPHAVTFAPGGTMWGSWTNIMTGEAREKMLQEREKWKPVVNLGFRHCQEEDPKGEKGPVEHPWASAMWKLPRVEQILGKGVTDAGTLKKFETVRADLCQYGLQDQVTGLLHQKATGFATALKSLKRRLPLRCDGNHLHQHLEGGRCRKAQEWTSDLCHEIVQGVLEEIDDSHTLMASPAAAEFEDGDNESFENIDAIHGREDFSLFNASPYERNKEIKSSTSSMRRWRCRT